MNGKELTGQQRTRQGKSNSLKEKKPIHKPSLTTSLKKIWTKWLSKPEDIGKPLIKAPLSRINSIDVFRGLIISLMLFCENPGNPQHVSAQFVHAPWNGITIADFGFPFFIFIAGASLPVSINKRKDRGASKLSIYIHILYRSMVIFLAGLFLNGFPAFDLSVIRIPGPLQRIAVVYLVAGVLILETNMLVEALTAVVLLVVYYLLVKYVNVPGHGAGILSQDGSLVQYIDMQLLKGHMYSTTWDPEGIMGTIPSISTILSGVIGGQVLISAKLKKPAKIICLLTAGAAGILLAGLFNNWFPVNKNLWSSTFVLYTSGAALIILSLLYLISDVGRYLTAFKPFLILGKDALFIYVGFELVRRTLWMLTMADPVSGANTPLYLWITNRIITPWAGNIYDSYYFSLLYILVWVIIIRYLRGKKPVEKA